MSRMLLSSLSPTSMERVNTSETHESSVPVSRILSTVSAALLVGISYYVGTRIGFCLDPQRSAEFDFGLPTPFFWPRFC